VGEKELAPLLSDYEACTQFSISILLANFAEDGTGTAEGGVCEMIVIPYAAIAFLKSTYGTPLQARDYSANSGDL
jgi:hypothetical protein